LKGGAEGRSPKTSTEGGSGPCLGEGLGEVAGCGKIRGGGGEGGGYYGEGGAGGEVIDGISRDENLERNVGSVGPPSPRWAGKPPSPIFSVKNPGGWRIGF